MRVFLAGGSGVIGLRLIPLLLDKGYEVMAMTRSTQKIPVLHKLGALTSLCDIYEKSEFINTVEAFKPDVFINQLTALPDNPDQIQKHANLNNRIRTEGIDNVIEALTKSINKPLLITQSVAWELPGYSGDAVTYLENRTVAYGGIVLRYGRFYGKNTYFENNKPPSPRIQIEDAAHQTLNYLNGPSGIFDIAEN